MRVRIALVILSLFGLQRAEAVSATADCRGQIVNIAGGDVEMLAVFTGTNLVSVWDVGPATNAFQVGDIVNVRKLDQSATSGRNTVYPAEISRERHGVLPVPPPIDIAEFNASSPAHSYATALRGTLVSVTKDDTDSQWNWLTVDSDRGRAFAATPEKMYPLAALEKLIDAEIECRGLHEGAQAGWRSFIGSYLMLFGGTGIVTLRSPPEDPFAVSSSARPGYPHRQTVEGVVLGLGANVFFISTDSHGFLPVRTRGKAPRLSCGTRVVASGFVSNGHNGPQLTEALVRVIGRSDAAPPPAMATSARELFSNTSGNALCNDAFYGKVIRVSATVRDIIRGARGETLLKLDFDNHDILFDISAIGDCGDVEPDCEVRASGICMAEFSNSPSHNFPTFNGFILYPRFRADLHVVRRPPWWTPARLCIVVGALFAGLILVIVWNVLLMRLSHRRAVALAAENFKLASAELKVEERTRLAVELHDALSQTLTGVALQIETALDVDRRADNRGRKFLETAQQMLASCRQELRLCLWDLRCRTFQEKDMTEAIVRTITPHSGTASVTVRFNVPRQSLSESSAHAILKIVRELVVNAIRHGHATSIRIAGERHGGQINFSVTDNGIGFSHDTAPGPAQGHFGLQGIRERAAELGGNVCIRSTVGGGTRVSVGLIDEGKDIRE